MAEPPAPPAPAGRPAGQEIPDVHHVVDRWDEVVDEVRRTGRGVVASLLEQALPVAVSGAGALTLQVEDEPAERAIEAARETIMAAIGAVFPALHRLNLRRADPGSAPPAARRLTTESIRAERIAALRKRDPALGAAIDALDLELMD